MKRIASIILCFVFSFFIIISTSKADSSCSYKDQQALNKLAQNIKRNYEIKEQKLPDGYNFSEDGIVDSNGKDVSKEFIDYYVGKYANIMITNLDEDIYIKVEDEDLISFNDGDSEFYYDDTKDGVLELKVYRLSKYRNIRFSVYANTSTCNNKITSFYVKIPRYNNFYNMDICKGIQDYKYCQEYLFNNTSDVKVRDKILEYKKSLKNGKQKDSKKISYKRIIIIISIMSLGLIITGICLFIIIKKWKEKRI